MSTTNSDRIRLACAVIALLSFLSIRSSHAQEADISRANQLVSASANIQQGVIVRSSIAPNSVDLDVTAPPNARFQVSHGKIIVEKSDKSTDTHPRVIAEFE